MVITDNLGYQTLYIIVVDYQNIISFKYCTVIQAI